MNQPGRLELRVLSGPHVGAALELGPGRYVVGRGDNCDLVLADDSVAERHLALVIRAGSGPLAVTVRPLEGRVFLDGGPLAPDADSTVPSGAVLALGFTALGWRPPGEAWEPANLVSAVYRVPWSGADGERTVEAEGAKGGGAEPRPVPDLLVAPETGEDSPPKEPPGSRRAGSRKWGGRSLILALAVLAVLAALVLGPLLESFLSGRAREARRVESLLREQGFGQLRTESGPDGVMVSGLLSDDRELSRLVRLVASQPTRVYLTVEVEDDLVRAVRELMLARGFFPEVRRVDGQLSVAAYLRDGLVEARLFETLRGDMAGLGRPLWRVVYAPQVKAVLEEELGRVGLGDMALHFGDGWIEWGGELDLAGRQRLEQARTAAESRLKVPLGLRPAGALPAVGAGPAEVQPFASGPVTLPGQTGPVALADAVRSPDLDPLGGLKIMGVTLEPLRFLTTQDGRKYFEGGVLPSGYTVTAISAREITLARDGRTVSHQLPGASLAP